MTRQTKREEKIFYRRRYRINDDNRRQNFFLPPFSCPMRRERKFMIGESFSVRRPFFRWRRKRKDPSIGESAAVLRVEIMLIAKTAVFSSVLYLSYIRPRQAEPSLFFAAAFELKLLNPVSQTISGWAAALKAKGFFFLQDTFA